jgi:hypothetical protein
MCTRLLNNVYNRVVLLTISPSKQYSIQMLFAYLLLWDGEKRPYEAGAVNDSLTAGIRVANQA